MYASKINSPNLYKNIIKNTVISKILRNFPLEGQDYNKNNNYCFTKRLHIEYQLRGHKLITCMKLFKNILCSTIQNLNCVLKIKF